MTWKECKEYIYLDLNRLTDVTFYKVVRYLFFNPSFRITFWFRVGNYLQTKRNLFSKIMLFFLQLIHKHNQYLTGI